MKKNDQGQKADRNRHMKDDPVFPLLVSMGVPMAISMLANSLYNIVDSYFVANFSGNAMTALSLVFPIQNVITAIGVGFGVGINSVIAQALGAQKQERADAAATQGVLLSAIHGLIINVVCILIMPAFLGLYTSDPVILRYGMQYSVVVFWFSVIVNLQMAYQKIFQAVGRMKMSMTAMLLGCGINILIDPLLIFGPGPLPRLGVIGAALGTGISQSISLAYYLINYHRLDFELTITKKHIKPDKEICGRLYSIGTAAALNTFLPSVLTGALNAILVSFSASYVFVLGVYYRLQNFLYMTASGFVQGMRPLAAYNYGAKEKSRVWKIFVCTIFVIGGIMAFGVLMCLFAAGPLMRLFSEDQEIIETGITAFRIMCIGFIPSAVSVAATGALEALGKGIPSLIISILRYAAVIIPAAYLMSRLCGAVGVWHAFWIAEIITAACAFVIFKRVFNKSMI